MASQYGSLNLRYRLRIRHEGKVPKVEARRFRSGLRDEGLRLRLAQVSMQANQVYSDVASGAGVNPRSGQHCGSRARVEHALLQIGYAAGDTVIVLGLHGVHPVCEGQFPFDGHHDAASFTASMCNSSHCGRLSGAKACPFVRWAESQRGLLDNLKRLSALLCQSCLERIKHLITRTICGNLAVGQHDEAVDQVQHAVAVRRENYRLV
jgi:hypothetical protein